jgi:hypothetical protein
LGAPRPGTPPLQLAHARASSLLCLASTNRTAAHLIEPPSPAPHSGPPSATDRMDDWSASDRAPAAVSGPAPNHPRPVTSALTRARPFMDGGAHLAQLSASAPAGSRFWAAGLSGRLRLGGLAEHAGDEFVPAADAQLVEDRLEVVLDGVCQPDLPAGRANPHQPSSHPDGQTRSGRTRRAALEFLTNADDERRHEGRRVMVYLWGALRVSTSWLRAAARLAVCWRRA